MSAASQSHFEKTVNAILFVLFMLIGWAPFFYFTLNEPYSNPALLAFSAALAVVSAALVFDSAERFLGLGKGLYAIAIFCSTASVGAIISDSALLPISGLMFISASLLWLAVRAKADNRVPMIAMSGALLLISGYLFSFFPAMAALLFPVWLSVRNVKPKAIVLMSLIGCFAAGAILNLSLELGIPGLVELSTPPDYSTAEILFMLLPWTVWMIPALFARSEQKLNAIGALLIVIAFVIAQSTSLYPLAMGCVIAPSLSLIVTAVLFEYFSDKKRSWPVAFSLLITAAGFLLFTYARIAVPSWIDRPQKWAAMLTLAAAIFIIAFWIRKLPRWVFAGVVLGGFAVGSIIWTRAGLLDMGDTESSLPANFSFLLPGFFLAVIAVRRKLYGPHIPASELKSGQQYLYSRENFRLFRKTGEHWGGTPMELSNALNENYSFAIFGDVAGAELPFGSRSGGYFVYRSLCRKLRRQPPAFAICLGDLSITAGEKPFRRLRQMLRHFPSPLAAIPGNHDIFDGDNYRPEFFHALFGADHSEFSAGGIHFILFNNARGGIDEEQFTWLESVLQRSVSPLRFVFCHKPLFDPRDQKSYQMENREHAERMHALFVKYRVTAVFSGHIHSLIHSEREGINYIISGGGGSQLADDNSAHHYLSVDVANGNATITAKAIDKSAGLKPLSLEFRGGS